MNSSNRRNNTASNPSSSSSASSALATAAAKRASRKARSDSLGATASEGGPLEGGSAATSLGQQETGTSEALPPPPSSSPSKQVHKKRVDEKDEKDKDAMYVVKRSGKQEIVSFDKIFKRIKKVGMEVGIKINYAVIAIKIIEQLYDGISTTKIDELSAEQCAAMSSIHPDYNVLAGRILISNHHKNTEASFCKVMKKLYNAVDSHNKHSPIISQETYKTICANSEMLDSLCVYSRDYFIDYFGFRTLEKSYLMRINKKVVERPQHMWLRVAVGIHGNNMERVAETYHNMSNKYFIHATPTLFNAGTPRPQCSSCFLMAMESDSIEGIFNTLKDCALISKYSGGIGLHIHNIRATGSQIYGTNGTSNGIVPMLRVFNNTAKYVDQGGGKRNGSFAIYLEVWHADVEYFLEMRKNHGEEETKARDLFYALWVSDLFMKRVKADENWSLMCPNECRGLADVYGDEFDELYTKYEREGKASKTVPARDLWYRILDAQMETGTPYLLFKDACNKKSNQKNVGVIKSSNLCVAPETPILTSRGYFPIASLLDQEVEVWNGEAFSTVQVRQTGVKKHLIEVHTSDGCILHCTPYHKFFIENANRMDIKSAVELKKGDQIAKCTFPVIDLPELDMEVNINDFSVVPINASLSVKMKWLSNYCRQYGITQFSTLDEINIQDYLNTCLTLPFKFQDERVHQVKLMLQTCGINVAYERGGTARSPGSSSPDFTEIHLKWIDIFRLLEHGFEIENSVIHGYYYFHYLEVRASLGFVDILQPVFVEKVLDRKREDDTFCFNEPQKHRGVFNGILTSQCTEIVEYSDEKETAVCNLASIGLPSFVVFPSPPLYSSSLQTVTEPVDEGTTASTVTSITASTPIEGEDGFLSSTSVSSYQTSQPYFDFEKLHAIAKIVTYNLNKVIDVSFYPTEKARRSNMRHRPIGIGVQGLADVFMLLGLPFTSPEAKQLNKQIFETIYHGALEQSMEMAVIEGPYETFAGSPASQGLLQFDLWNITNHSNERYDWTDLKEKIQKNGLRNSLLLAPMPTASTSQILGFNECIEPITSNIYTRRTLAGEFIIANKYLMKDLIQLGLWNEKVKNHMISNNGSIQTIPNIPPKIKEKYKTVWELPMKHIIDMACDRAIYICQSQSLNLWLEDPTYNSLTSMHFYSWSKGLKTGIYYLRRRAKHMAQQFTIEPEKAGGGAGVVTQDKKASETKDGEGEHEVCEMCSS